MDLPPSTALAYTIADSSPYSGQHAPENVLVDSPRDQVRKHASITWTRRPMVIIALLSLDIPLVKCERS
jgi:hypothetical protein